MQHATLFPQKPLIKIWKDTRRKLLSNIKLKSLMNSSCGVFPVEAAGGNHHTYTLNLPGLTKSYLMTK